MKLDERTVQILSNFSQFHREMHFPAGDVIRIMTESKSVVARAQLDEPIEKEFAIKDLPRFLGVVRLFDDPVIHITDHTLEIAEGDKRVSYTHANPAFVLRPVTKDIKVDADVKFRMPWSVFKEVRDAAAALGHKELAVIGDKSGVFLETLDSENPTSDVYRVRVSDGEKKFKLLARIDQLRLIPTDYDVVVSLKGIMHLRSGNLEYFIALGAK